MYRFLIIIAILAVLCGVALIVMYNAFVGRRNRMRQAFSGIDVHLKRRWELIPNLVQTVQGYADHERKTLEKVIHARNAARDARSGSKERFLQEETLGAGLDNLFVVAEAYPELKANEQFFNLQRNLTEIESQISAARRAYNESVTRWNDGVEAFPGSVMASWFEFERAEWFETSEAEREAVDVRIES